MSFADNASPPPNHPISPARARELMGGDLGDEYSRILETCVAPLYWHGPDRSGKRHILSNGTLTIVKSPDRVMGVTAAHVLADYFKVKNDPGVRCQLMNAELEPEVIDCSDALDLATLVLTPEVLAAAGKDVVPVPTAKQGDAPQEGRGIMICGYPGQDRDEGPDFEVVWKPFKTLGVARRVNAHQITWVPDREYNIPRDDVQMPPPNKDLGGISGGPLIAWYEKVGGKLTYYSLAGIVVEASAALENVVAIRTEHINPDGTFR